MSITPIEREEDGRAREPPRNEGPNLGARLKDWMRSLSRRVRRVFSRAGTDTGDPETDPGSGRTVKMRVGGQRRLTAEPESATAAEPQGPPPAREKLPGSTDVDAERDGETLRVYNPQQEEAFIASDTWQDVEQ